MKISDREAIAYIQGGLEMLRAFIKILGDEYEAIDDELCSYYNTLVDLRNRVDGEANEM